MTPIIGPGGRIFCTIECLRRTWGVLANPSRLAFHFEFDDHCEGCGSPLFFDNEEAL